MALAVQHVQEPATAATMAQLCTGVHKALQQSVGALSVRLDVDSDTLPGRLTKFAAWLPHYPALVGGLAVHCNLVARPSSETLLAAEQLLVFALQHASGGAAPGAAKPALQLKCFGSNFIDSPAAMGALVKCRELVDLELPEIKPGIAASLAQMTSLTSLKVMVGDSEVNPDSLAALRNVPLQVLITWPRVGLPARGLMHLPPTLTSLECAVELTGGDPAVLDLGHLTALKELNVEGPARGNVIEESRLPSGLTTLSVFGPIGASTSGLQQVQQIYVKEARWALPLLDGALPELRELQVGLAGCSTQQLHAAASAIGAATQLTSLWLFGHSRSDDDTSGQVNIAAIQLHPHLGKLRALRDLSLIGLKLAPGDSVHFTRLAPLTRLKVYNCTMDDVSMAAILQRTTSLQCLEVTSTVLSSPLLWVTLACLTNLGTLKWFNNDDENVPTDQTLHLLSPLTKLTEVALGGLYDEDGDCTRPVSAAVERSLLQRLPHLRRIEWV